MNCRSDIGKPDQDAPRSHSEDDSSRNFGHSKHKDWEMLDVRLPLTGNLEELDAGPVHSVNTDCKTIKKYAIILVMNNMINDKQSYEFNRS